MRVDDLTSREAREDAIEKSRQARRREQALLRSPVRTPSRHLRKDVRRIAQETKEELRLRG